MRNPFKRNKSVMKLWPVEYESKTSPTWLQIVNLYGNEPGYKIGINLN
jgi:hypothetical protein